MRNTFVSALCALSAIVLSVSCACAAPPKADKAATASVPQTITSPLGHPLSLVWHDEFDAVPDKDGKPYIDRSKWQTTFWQGSSQRSLFSNVEAQYYVDKDYNGEGNIHPEANGSLNPFSFETPGILTIKAWKTPEELWRKFYMGEQRPFSSGLLISDKRFTFQYGYVEGRFKLPGVRGAWPAFWLLGDDPTKATEDEAHQWPPEVDLFEFFGHRPTKHSAGILPREGEEIPWKFGYNEVGADISKDFHTWGLEWTPEDMVFTFDGKVWAKSKTAPAFNRPMYLLINLAVGGQWYSQEMDANKTPYKPWQVDEASMPWKMQCDYVRVYQSKANAAQIAAYRATDKALNNHLTREVWTDIRGKQVSDIPVASKPHSVTYLRDFEAPTSVGINYGTRLRGYLTPPTTGDYTFWIAGDDNCELRLGMDDKPAGAVKIASVTTGDGYTGRREWNKLPEQKSAPVHLQAGKRYYIEALQKQDVGGDSLSVGWLKPGQTGNVPSEIIPASVLSPWTDQATSGKTALRP